MFKNKIVIVLGIIVLIILTSFISIYFILSSNFKLNGEKDIYIEYNETYKENGATLKIFGKNLSKRISVKSNIENGKIGDYKVTYKFNYLLFSLKKERLVHIVDKTKPVITLNGEEKITICPFKEYEEEGFTAIDDYDSDITSKVIVTKVSNGYEYEVSDSFGNKEKVFREIEYVDTIAPNLSLKGNNKIYIRNGNSYNEPGYDVNDNCDENISVNVEGSVNTDVDGTYTITYTAQDSSSNESVLTRDVVVYTDNRIGIVYLTFDDGPSGTGSTEKILNILKEQDVHATFFVTGSGPDYLIKREYDEGHVVALHTFTHNYGSVYASTDAYYNDLNSVRDRVYNITGVYSNIIRFPGGSNNTVSNKYNYGIMDVLTRDVLDKGYTYFDWNITSGDAGECTTSSCVYNRVINSLSKSRINIVLMHDIKMFTANALNDIINYCKNNGYVFDVITEETQPVRFK